MSRRDVSYINVQRYLEAKPMPTVRPQGWTISTTLACAVLGLLLYWIACELIGKGGSWR